MNMITISQEEYKNLKEIQIFMECMEKNGVYSWDGYATSYQEFQNLINQTRK